MKNKIEDIIFGLLSVLTVVVISMVIIGIGIEVKDMIRKDQEHRVCKKLGGYYDYSEKCVDAVGGAIILPEVK